jgi:hypothetical protein
MRPAIFVATSIPLPIRDLSGQNRQDHTPLHFLSSVKKYNATTPRDKAVRITDSLVSGFGCMRMPENKTFRRSQKNVSGGVRTLQDKTVRISQRLVPTNSKLRL